MSVDFRLNGMETRWHEHGSKGGRPLLCLHPLGQNGTFFDGLAKVLGPSWRLISYDQRGHGLAAGTIVETFQQMVDDAEAALDIIGNEVHVAGFSMGGAVAAQLAARRVGSIPTLTLVATPYAGLPVFAERACAMREGSIAAISERTVERWFGRTSGEPAIETARRALAMLSPEGFDAAWRVFATFDGYDAIAQHLPPTLCLSFAEDLSTPPPILDRIAETIRNAGGRAWRANIEDAGHLGLLQKPFEVAEILAEFITKQGGGGVHDWRA